MARMSKIQKGGTDRYGAERFGRLIFVTMRKSVGLKGLIKHSPKPRYSLSQTH